MPPDHAVALSELPLHVVPLRITPSAARSLALELPIPRGWEQTYGRATELCHLGLPIPLAVFQLRDPLALDPAGRPALVVSATRRPFEVDLGDWCRFRLVATRWMVLDAPPICAHLNKLQHGPAVALVERRRAVELGATRVRFEVPASWEMHRPGPGAVTKRRVTCDAASATLALGARATPVSTAVERSAALVDHLACMGVTPLDAGRFDAPRDDPRAAMHGWRGGVLVDAIGPKLRTVEVRAWCRRVGPFKVDGTLMVEPDLSRPLGWIRAVRTLEIAMASARWEAIA